MHRKYPPIDDAQIGPATRKNRWRKRGDGRHVWRDRELGWEWSIESVGHRATTSWWRLYAEDAEVADFVSLGGAKRWASGGGPSYPPKPKPGNFAPRPGTWTKARWPGKWFPSSEPMGEWVAHPHGAQVWLDARALAITGRVRVWTILPYDGDFTLYRDGVLVTSFSSEHHAKHAAAGTVDLGR